MEGCSLTVRSTPLGRMMCKVTGRERLSCWGHQRPFGVALAPVEPPLLALSPTSASVRNLDWMNVGTLATDMLKRREMRRPRLRGASVTIALNTWYSFIFDLWSIVQSVSVSSVASSAGGTPLVALSQAAHEEVYEKHVRS